MKKKTILCITIMFLLNLLACSKENQNTDLTEKETKKQENINENNYEQETIEEYRYFEYKYAEYFDNNLIWYEPTEAEGFDDFEFGWIESDNKGVYWPDYLERMFNKAKEVCDDSTTATERYEKMKYVINASVLSTKDAEYIYFNYIKKLDIETEFSGITDEEAIAVINDRYPFEAGESVYSFDFKIYVTEEEILSMEGLEEFEQGVLLSPVYRGALEVDDESIDYYYDDLLPVSYMDEATGEHMSKYETKDKVRELIKEYRVYWDWDLMYKQMWE